MKRERSIHDRHRKVAGPKTRLRLDVRIYWGKLTMLDDMG